MRYTEELLINAEAEFDYYNRRTIGGVFPVPTLSSPGYANSVGYLDNNATIQNQGLAVALRWTPTSTGDFSYSLGFTGAYNQNKVISTRDGAVFFAGNLPLGDYRTTISRVGAFYGYQATGVFQTAQEVTDSPQSASAKPGDLRYQDTNGDGQLDACDCVVLGNPNPRFTAAAALWRVSTSCFRFR